MIPASVRVLVCTQPIDMRRSFDGLPLAVRQAMGQELPREYSFVFPEPARFPPQGDLA